MKDDEEYTWESNIRTPDFKEIASQILDRTDLEFHLKKMWDDGFEQGENYSWVKVWDADDGWIKENERG